MNFFFRMYVRGAFEICIQNSCAFVSHGECHNIIISFHYFSSLKLKKPKKYLKSAVMKNGTFFRSIIYINYSKKIITKIIKCSNDFPIYIFKAHKTLLNQFSFIIIFHMIFICCKLNVNCTC